MKKKTKIILYIMVSIVLLGIIFGTVDYFMIKDNKKPVFAWNTKCKCGDDIKEYQGLWYKIAIINGIEKPVFKPFGLGTYAWFKPNISFMEYDINQIAVKKLSEDKIFNTFSNNEIIDEIERIIVNGERFIEMCTNECKDRGNGFACYSCVNPDDPDYSLLIIGDNDKTLLTLDLWVYDLWNIYISYQDKNEQINVEITTADTKILKDLIKTGRNNHLLELNFKESTKKEIKQLFPENSAYTFYSYGLDEINIIIDSNEYLLEDALRTGKITPNEIIINLEYGVEYSNWEKHTDKNTNYFLYKTSTFSFMKCNTGTKDYYIGVKDMKYDKKLCK